MYTHEIIALIKQGRLEKFYKSTEWRSKRGEALRRDHNECQICKTKGKYKQAECVHHIKEVKPYPQLAFVLDNLMSLCKQCHNDIHDKLKIREKQKPKFENEERW